MWEQQLAKLYPKIRDSKIKSRKRRKGVARVAKGENKRCRESLRRKGNEGKKGGKAGGGGKKGLRNAGQGSEMLFQTKKC